MITTPTFLEFLLLDRQAGNLDRQTSSNIYLHQLHSTQLAAPHQLLYLHSSHPAQVAVQYMWFRFKSVVERDAIIITSVGHNRESTNDCKADTLSPFFATSLI